MTRDEEKETERMLGMLTADPINSIFEDREFKMFKTKRFERAFPGKQRLDATGRGMDTPPVVRDVEPFEPTLRRDDLNFAGAVGEDERNRPADVIKAKKALANTGLFSFDVTKEMSTDAGPLFRDATKAFQRLNGIEPDGCIRPDCPTRKALGGLFFPEGSTNSKANPVDLRPAARAMEAAAGSGGALQANAGAQSPASGSPSARPPGEARGGESEMAVHMRPPTRPGGPGRGGGTGKPPRSSMERIVEEIIDKIPTIGPPEAKQENATEPAHIIVYPDGRLFLATDPVTGKPKKYRRTEKVILDTNVKFAREFINENLPAPAGDGADKDDGTVREESEVVVEKLDENGKLIRWLLVDPESGQPLRAPQRDPVVLTPEQVIEKGLSHMDTSRRSGPNFNDLMQLMQQFGKDVGNEVLKRLFGTRGARRR